MMKQSRRILQLLLLLTLTATLQGQRPGMNGFTSPDLSDGSMTGHMLLRTLDAEKKPVISEYDCKTGKSTPVSRLYKSDMQKLRELLPEGVTPGQDMAVAADRIRLS